MKEDRPLTREEIEDILDRVHIQEYEWFIDDKEDEFCSSSEEDAETVEIAIKALLNLADKQQKEIKELKGITKEYDSYIGEKMPLNSKIIIADREYFINGTFVNKFVSKDKIRKEIAKTEEELYNGEMLQRFAYIKIETLKELLEE